jgi:hypothetical protein
MFRGWFGVAPAVSVVALAVACLLAVSASASETSHPVEFRPGGRITSRGSLTFNVGEARIACNVSLSGTFVSGAMEFELGENLGSASTVSAEGCRGGTVTPQAEARAPWSIWVHEALGTLPEGVTGATIWFAPIAVLVRSESISSCLYSDARLGGLLEMRFVEGTRWTYRTGSITMSTAEDEWSRPTKLEGASACPTAPTVSGTLSFTTEEMTAQTPPQFNFGPSNFNIIYVGTSTHRIIFTNRTTNPIGPLNASVIHYGNRGFSVTPGSDLCNGATVAANGTCSVEVTYTAPGTAPRTDLLKLMLGGVVQGSTWVRAQTQ